MATVTKGKTFVSDEVVTPVKLNQLVDNAQVSNIVDADIAAGAAISDAKLATISTANKVSQSAVTGLVNDLSTLATAVNAKANATHTHGNLTSDGRIGNLSGLPVITGTNGLLTTGQIGTTAGTIAAGNHSHPEATTSAGGFMSATDKTKLNGLPAIPSPGSAGSVLTSNGTTSTPSWQTLSATSTNANNLTGGSAGTLPYQSAAGTTAMVPAGSSGQVLQSGGTGAPSWRDVNSANTANSLVARDANGSFSANVITATSFVGTLSGSVSSAATASNLTGGLTGTIPYQSSPGVTAMLATGTSGQVLKSNGAAAPSWLTLANSATTDTTNASNITSGTLANARTTATNANTASAIVARDASGNFSAGTITASLSGNASSATTAAACTGNAATATKLATARTISLTGDVTGSATFDGSANASITATVADDSHNHTIANIDGLQTALDGKQAAGSYAASSHTHSASNITTGTLDNARTTATNANTASAIVARDASGNFSAGTITAALTGNASSATNLAGGSAGTLPYQSGANTTAMLAAGTSGQYLKSNGTAAPSWASVMQPKAFLLVKFTNDNGSFTTLRSQSVTMERVGTGEYNFTFSPALPEIPIIVSHAHGQDYWVNVTTTSATCRMRNLNNGIDDPLQSQFGDLFVSFLFF